MFAILAALITALYFLHVYRKSINRFCTSTKRLDGKTVLVTGGTSGLGLQAALDFAKRGARLLIACPFEEEGRSAKREIERRTGNKNVVFLLLDLSSLKSVREVAAHVLKTEERLDVLVNNAGVVIPSNLISADRINFVMQVNYYGHFLLTLLLISLLKKSGTRLERSRIVNVSSMAHRLADSDVTRYNEMGYYWSILTSYSNSKFSLVLFARELSKRLVDSDVVVNCVDPGIAATKIYQSVNVIIVATVSILLKLYFKNSWEGAQTTLYAALEDEGGSVSGEFFKNCKLTPARILAYDDKKCESLWNDSVKLVGLSDEELKHLLA